MKVTKDFPVHEAVSDTATVRAVFFIDPKQNIRARDELLRVVDALQASDANAGSQPRRTGVRANLLSLPLP